MGGWEGQQGSPLAGRALLRGLAEMATPATHLGAWAAQGHRLSLGDPWALGLGAAGLPRCPPACPATPAGGTKPRRSPTNFTGALLSPRQPALRAPRVLPAPAQEEGIALRSSGGSGRAASALCGRASPRAVPVSQGIGVSLCRKHGTAAPASGSQRWGHVTEHRPQGCSRSLART